MVALPILRGLYADETANFRVAYPVNFEPVITETGIGKGFLKAAPGIALVASSGLGRDRGGIVWNGIHYRVIGSKFVRIDGGAVTVLDDVGDNGLPVSLDFSFSLLAIASDRKLFYWNGSVMHQVTDPDLGAVLDVMYLDGRFITTDGSYIVLTELSDPYAVDPLKYGSAEVSPDAINGLARLRGEMYALGVGTIENFGNRGGAGFPYVRNPGALIPKGCVGTHAFCYFADTFAFVGNAPGEAASVWLAGGGDAIPISTPDIDRELAAVPTAGKPFIEAEARQEQGEQRLLIHLPTKTLVYFLQASKQAGEPVWAILQAGTANDEAYPLRHLTLVGNDWYGGTATGLIGRLDATIETLFGDQRGWEFQTLFIYNQAKGAIINSLELVGLSGRVPFGAIPQIFASYTLDGETWSNERAIESGRFGQRGKRLQFRLGWKISLYAGLRFRGAGNGREAFSSLEAQIEGLSA